MDHKNDLSLAGMCVLHAWMTGRYATGRYAIIFKLQLRKKSVEVLVDPSNWLLLWLEEHM